MTWVARRRNRAPPGSARPASTPLSPLRYPCNVCRRRVPVTLAAASMRATRPAPGLSNAPSTSEAKAEDLCRISDRAGLRHPAGYCAAKGYFVLPLVFFAVFFGAAFFAAIFFVAVFFLGAISYLGDVVRSA
jgi:hypothetical protein